MGIKRGEKFDKPPPNVPAFFLVCVPPAGLIFIWQIVDEQNALNRIKINSPVKVSRNEGEGRETVLRDRRDFRRL